MTGHAVQPLLRGGVLGSQEEPVVRRSPGDVESARAVPAGEGGFLQFHQVQSGSGHDAFHFAPKRTASLSGFFSHVEGPVRLFPQGPGRPRGSGRQGDEHEIPLPPGRGHQGIEPAEKPSAQQRLRNGNNVQARRVRERNGSKPLRGLKILKIHIPRGRPAFGAQSGDG
jgi:hypothetical protein